MLAGFHRRILGGFARSDAGGNAADLRVPIRLMEKCDGLAARGGALVSRRIYHAMQSGYPVVVGPARHQIADVDDERIRNDGDRLPLTIRSANFHSPGA